MNCNSFLGRTVTALTFVLFATLSAPAQPDSTIYISVDCMKSTSPDYLQVEQEIAQPIHQELVDQGKKLSWVLYGVEFGSRAECDYYTVNRYLGADALDRPYDSLQVVFEKVHPQADMGDAMARTMASRERVWTHLYATVGGIPPESFKYAHVNRMDAEDGQAYVNQEMSMFKPVHQALVDEGITKGWLVGALVSPSGSALGYNFVTVDFSDYPGPIPFGDYVAKVHPDADMQDIWNQTDGTRDFVLHETWRLVARTGPPAMMKDE
ncbi:MAG TPA: hypothetical protein VMO47_15040 [Rhodothermales bacterium]|nr:hypothetical protein [Rhodothermales bacterium]